METAAPGYSRPVQHGPLPDYAELAISEACPGAVAAPWRDAPNIHPYWGPWRGIATGYATDAALRFRASSGGALSALAIHALKSGQVDRVVHVIPDPDTPDRNVVTCSTTVAEIFDGAGSRYSSSSPLAAVDRVLSDGGAAAFVGKPCDISALRRLARVDSRVSKHIPLMLSFFCAGISSHRRVDGILAEMGLERDDVAAFRYRGNGWPGRAAATTHDGRIVEMSYAGSWGEHLSKEVQFRCKICPDAVGGVADVACADPWYGDARGYPSFDEQDGRSLIVTRTASGERLVAGAVAAEALITAPLDVGEIERMQPGQARRKRLVASRVAALAVTLQPTPAMNGTLVGKAARRAKPYEQLHSFAGALRRIILRRR
jgi:coenzyme F420 hydrogenase subunit beta